MPKEKTLTTYIYIYMYDFLKKINIIFVSGR